MNQALNTDKLIQLNNKIHNIIAKNDFSAEVRSLQSENGILSSEDLKKHLDEKMNLDRSLKIGILGRVKAGKSSLLNALIFDGKNVLPKAATPMTAALTVLQYGEETQAELDFFSQEDIDEIKKDAVEYKKQLDEKKEEAYQNRKRGFFKKNKRHDDNLTSEEEKEIKQKADSIALREMKNEEALSSAYDQWQRIEKSGVSLSELKKYQTIKADNIEVLNKQLFEFVGSTGRFMPYTKSVTISIHQNNLKDLQIIDTPGINDPVVSREERTKQLLKSCDVVLILSPSGQFLSNEDLELMDRLQDAEGIRELYIVASQVDNQLYASEKEAHNGKLPSVLKGIEEKLSGIQKNTILKYKESYPEIHDTLDHLIKQNVILSSGISNHLLKNFSQQQDWDENMKHVFKNLQDHYPDYFSDEESAKSNLKSLANISVIEDIINNIRLKKDEILATVKQHTLETEYKRLEEFKKLLIERIKERIHEIQNSDIDELKKQHEAICTNQEIAISYTDEVYEDAVFNLDRGLDEAIQQELKKAVNKSTEVTQNSQDTVQEAVYVQRNRFARLFDDTLKFDRYVNLTTIKAGIVRRSLEGLTSDMETEIERISKDKIHNYHKNLYPKIVAKLRSVVGDELLDEVRIGRAIKNVLNSTITPEISYTDSFPRELKKTGTLKGWQAEEFIEVAENYLSEIKKRIKKDFKAYRIDLITKLKSYQIGSAIFDDYKKEIEQLENNIKNKEIVLDRYQSILNELDALKG